LGPAPKKGEGVDRLRGTLPVYALTNRPMHGEGEMGGRLSLIMRDACDWFLGSLFDRIGPCLTSNHFVERR